MLRKTYCYLNEKLQTKQYGFFPHVPYTCFWKQRDLCLVRINYVEVLVKTTLKILLSQSVLHISESNSFQKCLARLNNLMLLLIAAWNMGASKCNGPLAFQFCLFTFVQITQIYNFENVIEIYLISAITHVGQRPFPKYILHYTFYLQHS